MKNPSNSAAFSHPALADLPALHAAVCEAVKQAGAMLEAEFSRARGPRGSYSKAPVDVEIEEFLHHALTALLPVPFRAEEKHDITPDAGGTLWLVDPHDGTSAFLGGFRGSAVSVALLHQACLCWAWCTRLPARTAARTSSPGRRASLLCCEMACR